MNDLGLKLGETSIEDIVGLLPTALKSSCNVLVTDKEKEVFLVSALGVLSGIMPSVYGMYDGSEVHPNMYTYIIGGYGNGKGSMKYAKMLAADVASAKKETVEMLTREYNTNFATYKRNLSAYNRSMSAGREAEMPIEPEKIAQRQHFIPGSITKAGLITLLKDNDGHGTMFESEGDTLAEAIKGKFGGFSDILRKAAHHETVSDFTKGDGGIEIEDAKLSVVISSTVDQLQLLIPSINNGLFSRFVYHVMEVDTSFHNVFNSKKSDYIPHFNDQAKIFKAMYDTLSIRDVLSDTEFVLSLEQQEVFVKKMKALKRKAVEIYGHTIGGTLNREATHTYRTMMVLSIVRAHEDGYIGSKVMCTDEDFDNAFMIMELNHASMTKVYEALKPGAMESVGKDKVILDMLQNGDSYSAIAKKLHISKATISKVAKGGSVVATKAPVALPTSMEDINIKK